MPQVVPLSSNRLRAAVALALGSLLVMPGAHAAAVVQLSSLDGGNGFRLDGAAYDRSGNAVSNAGDINGDGIDDLIIGAYGASPNGNRSGRTYVVFGRMGSIAATVSLASLDGCNGFRLDGVAENNESGMAVSAAGDINGDGIDDVIIGAGGLSSTNIGSSYVVFGRDTGCFASSVDLSSLSGSNGFRLDGEAGGDASGSAVSAAGDINGDGFDDLIIGAWGASPEGVAFAGSSYIVFGHSDGFASAISLSSLDGSNGFRLDGAATADFSGRAVSAAGDINGDGIDDLIIGAYGADPGGSRSGSTYVVFGNDTGSFASTINLSSLDGSNGFRLDGVAAGDGSGRAVSAAGDINGDGTDDLIIGAYATFAGSSFVVFGRSAGGFASVMALSSLDGSNGFRLDGEAAIDASGLAVSAAGDINGDGTDDLIIGALRAGPNGHNSGSSHVLFGRSDGGFDPTINLSSLDGSTGFRLDGVAARDYSGRSVSAAGDVNGDGIDDLIIGAHGAHYANPYGVSSAGSSYVVFGNAAPLLAPGASRLIEALEDDAEPAGSTVASLATALDVYLDADPLAGIAIDVDAMQSNAGEWQYRLHGADPWTTLPTGLSSSNALLLAPEASLRFVPVADFFGPVSPLGLRLWDGADAALYTFGPGQDIRQSIGGLGGFSNDANRLPVAAVILPVNDAPAFEANHPPAMLEGAGAQTVVGWASNFTPGPANESDQQVLGYLISNVSNPGFFLAAPMVGVDGTLSYTPAAGANGSASFSVQVQDDGGTDNGGVDTSPAQSFTLTVRSVAIFDDGFEGGVTH